MKLRLLPDAFVVAQIPATEPFPDWGCTGGFSSVTRTPEEWSVVCETSFLPDGIRAETDWRIIQIEAVLDFALTGILSSLLAPLAAAGIPVFVLSTYNTDYVMVRSRHLAGAVFSLSEAGYTWAETPPQG